MSLISGAIGILKKELLIEYKNKYSISTLFLYVIAAITICVFAIGAEQTGPEIACAIYWIILYFTSMVGLAKTFISEEESGCSIFLKVYADSLSVYFGKLLFNIVIGLSLSIISGLAYWFVFQPCAVESPILLALAIMSGSIAISSSSTIISAIVAKAGARGALFPALALPITIPILIAGVDAGVIAIKGGDSINAYKEIVFCFAYCGAIIAVSSMLFDFVWRD
jgi:heme exporter protein B